MCLHKLLKNENYMLLEGLDSYKFLVSRSQLLLVNKNEFMDDALCVNASFLTVIFFFHDCRD
jgi:hypothetical protein